MTAIALAAADAPQRFALGAADVEVWWAQLDVPPVRLAALRALLPPEERREGERYRCDPQRLLAARGLVREILGRRLGFDPASLRLGRTAAGKPYLVDSPRALAFNVSHASEWLVVAASTHGAVGVDVERLRADVDCAAVARHMFSAGEISALEALPAAERRWGFFSCWARKEACLKAIGTGFAIAPDRVEVGIDAAPALVSFAGDTWCVRGIPAPRPDLIAAVAVHA